MTFRYRSPNDKSILAGGLGSVSSFNEFAGPPACPVYGTILGSGTEPAVLNWEYAPGGYAGSGQFTYGSYGYNIIADGNCGTVIQYVGFAHTATDNQVIDDSEYNSVSRIIYKAVGYWSECRRAGPTGNTQIGNVTTYPSEAYGSLEITLGSYTDNEMYDGLCGIYHDVSYSYYPYGTWVGGWNDYSFYSDGNGGYYYEQTSSCPAYGTWLEGSSSDLTYYFSNDFISTYLTIGSSGYSVYADGNCGNYTESGSYYYSYGTQVGSYYDYNSYTTYYIYSDGMGGVYTFN